MHYPGRITQRASRWLLILNLGTGFFIVVNLKRDWASLAQDQAGGVLNCAAVPRVGLGPTAPPLRRYAEYTTGLI